MTQVMDAVNAIQDTRWAIDGRTYRMIQWVREQGLRPAKSFPASELPPMPRKATKEERSEEHTSELQSLMRISYAVFCLKKKKYKWKQHNTHSNTTNETHNLTN